MPYTNYLHNFPKKAHRSYLALANLSGPVRPETIIKQDQSENNATDIMKIDFTIFSKQPRLSRKGIDQMAENSKERARMDKKQITLY